MLSHLRLRSASSRRDDRCRRRARSRCAALRRGSSGRPVCPLPWSHALPGRCSRPRARSGGLRTRRRSWWASRPPTPRGAGSTAGRRVVVGVEHVPVLAASTGSTSGPSGVSNSRPLRSSSRWSNVEPAHEPRLVQQPVRGREGEQRRLGAGVAVHQAEVVLGVGGARPPAGGGSCCRAAGTSSRRRPPRPCTAPGSGGRSRRPGAACRSTSGWAGCRRTPR